MLIDQRIPYVSYRMNPNPSPFPIEEIDDSENGKAFEILRKLNQSLLAITGPEMLNNFGRNAWGYALTLQNSARAKKGLPALSENLQAKSRAQENLGMDMFAYSQTAYKDLIKNAMEHSENMFWQSPRFYIEQILKENGYETDPETINFILYMTKSEPQKGLITDYGAVLQDNFFAIFQDTFVRSDSSIYNLSEIPKEAPSWLKLPEEDNETLSLETISTKQNRMLRFFWNNYVWGGTEQTYQIRVPAVISFLSPALKSIDGRPASVNTSLLEFVQAQIPFSESSKNILKSFVGSSVPKYTGKPKTIEGVQKEIQKIVSENKVGYSTGFSTFTKIGIGIGLIGIAGATYYYTQNKA